MTECVLELKVKYGQSTGRIFCGPEVLKRSATWELISDVAEISSSWFPETFSNVDSA